MGINHHELRCISGYYGCLVHAQERVIRTSLMHVSSYTIGGGTPSVGRGTSSHVLPRPSSNALFAYTNISHACALMLNVTYPQVIYNIWGVFLLEVKI